MFGKKTCSRCGKKVNKDFDFCPSCGFQVKNKKEYENDWGILGKNDLFEDEEDELKLPFGFNAIFNSLMKSLDKQFKELNKGLMKDAQLNKNNDPFLNNPGSIRINISSFGNEPPRISVNTSRANQNQNVKQKEEMTKKELSKLRNNFSEKNMQKLLTLPRTQPSTQVRRLSNKIIYEIDVPGVESLNDVSISQLENSVEIKAVGKDKVYSKLIPINLPINDHKFSKGKLILEFLAR